MWQRCPLCNGSGSVPAHPYSTATSQTCTVCNGAKIISELTGLPPSTGIQKFPSSNDRIFNDNPLNNYGNGCQNKQCFCDGSCKGITRTSNSSDFRDNGESQQEYFGNK